MMIRVAITTLTIITAITTSEFSPQAEAGDRWIDRFECCTDDCCDDGCCDCDYDWSGPYIGLHTGYSFLNPNSAAFNLIQDDSNGGALGLHGGINRQNGSLVYGVEADFTFTELDSQVPCFNPAFDCLAASDWNASLRARLGKSFDRLLVFGTAGVSFADYHGFTRNIGLGTQFNDQTTMAGLTVGGGLEYALTDCARIRAEYRYANYDDFVMNYDVPYLVDPDMHTINIGLNVSF